MKKRCRRSTGRRGRYPTAQRCSSRRQELVARSQELASEPADWSGPRSLPCLFCSLLLAPRSHSLMNILGIETSCDETAVAVVADGRRVLSNVVASQVELHARYGGVVPELASRQHVQAMIPVLDEALERAQLGLREIDAIAVTFGPGLAGAL